MSMTPMRFLCCLLMSLACFQATSVRAESVQPATYVGAQACVSCHAAESERWSGSHHDMAMTEASEATVLGDFHDVTFTAQGVTSRFFRRDGKYFVHTDGPDGQLRDYEIRYTFGWWPLQQYLIEFPGGRLQSLGIAWDSRAAEEGGQRWYHLYPHTRLEPGSPLHWTGRDQTWNYQCAECHSTNLNKGYDLATDTYRTTWSEIDVACESCHGPASRHVEQARTGTADRAPAWDAGKGLVVDLSDRDGGVWTRDEATALPRRSVPRAKDTQLEVCARCHSRRGQISEANSPGRPLGDSHRLALLETQLYHADGQIKDEVFDYGSFIQSRMHAQGVTCSDCHDPHRLTLKAPGNLVCAQCHQADRYDVETHHHHAPNSGGAACVACHMPQRRYMVIDARADHSLRIPRPDLTLKIGTPNACNDCHADQTAQWALEATRQWYGEATSQRPHYGEALHAGRTGAPDAGQRLIALAADTSQPGIARATALDLLRGFYDPTHLLTLGRLLRDEEALVRAAAVRVLDATDPGTLLNLGFPLLEDPILAVRAEAARTLAPLAILPLPDEQKQRLEGALSDYRATQRVNAERPESHLNIGLVETAVRDAHAAEQSYRAALRLDPHFAPGYANLADLYRALGRDAEGETVLREGLAAVPDDASLHHALGLRLIRAKAMTQAVESLTRAAQLAPESARYAYVRALAVKGTGDLAQGLALLREAHERHPADRDILVALVSFSRESGDQDAARDYAARLQALAPGAGQ